MGPRRLHRGARQVVVVTPLLFLVGAVLATPVVFAAAVAAVTWWFEQRWLPRIAGAE